MLLDISIYKNFRNFCRYSSKYWELKLDCKFGILINSIDEEKLPMRVSADVDA